MKRILIHTMLMFSVIQMGTTKAAAQAGGDSPMLSSTLYREKLYLFTDRSLYASGETVCFRLYNLSHPLLKENNWSRVFYLELVNSRHTAIARGKYQVNAWGGDGQIIIPDTAGTGPYYLRAYTSWMRNYLPSEYFHLPLAIVNPRKISSADLSESDQRQVSAVQTPEQIPDPVVGIVCSPDQNSYGKREKVSVRIHPEHRGASPDAYCISVIKKGYLDEAFHYNSASASGDTFRLKDLVHYPETRGVSVSGTVFLGEEQEPAYQTLLGMTLLGSDPDYLEFRTDENGRFRIPVPRHTGNQDALLTIPSIRDAPVRILLDEDFSPDFSTAPVPATDFFGERQALVEDVLVNSQLRSAYQSGDRDSVLAREPVDREPDPDDPFYGTPEFRYRTEDYVLLPNLEEFLFEIVHQVRVEINKDKKQLLVLDERDENMHFPPLVLLDYVPVTDMGYLMSVSPQLIDHIDIVNRRYFRGGIRYGGIVSIISRRGDRAGAPLPGASGFISFTGLSQWPETLSPDYNRAARNERIPDLRNTLYWSAHYEITPENGGSFEFYTSDETGEYWIVVRGMDADGNVLSGICEFTVK